MRSRVVVAVVVVMQLTHEMREQAAFIDDVVEANLCLSTPFDAALLCWPSGQWPESLEKWRDVVTYALSPTHDWRVRSHHASRLTRATDICITYHYISVFWISIYVYIS